MRPIYGILILLVVLSVRPSTGAAQFEGADTAFTRALLERLENAAKELPDPRERDLVLADVARLWADAQHPLRANSLAARVKYPGVRGLSRLIERALINRPEAVHEIVRRCELPCQRDSLWVSAVGGFLRQRNVAAARMLADSIQHPVERINALFGVAQNQARTEPEELRLTLQRIYSSARGVTDPERRWYAVHGAVHAGVFSNDLSGALQLVDEEPGEKQLGHLTYIALYLSNRRDPREDSIRALIVRVAQSLPDSALRNEHVGFYTWARESSRTDDVSELQKIASRLGIDSEMLSSALWRVAMERINAGQYRRALEIVSHLRRLNQPTDIADVLTRLVEHASRGNAAQSEVLSVQTRREFVAEALRAASRIEEPTTRDERVFSIASVIAESQPDQTLTLVSTIASTHYRDQARMAAFRTLLNRNAARAFEVARMLENPALQVDAYGALVRHQFRQGRPRQSAEAVRRIADPAVRTQVRAVLAHVWQERGNTEQALAEYRQILQKTNPSEHYAFICKHIVSPMLSLGGLDELQAWVAHQGNARHRALALLLLAKGVVEPAPVFHAEFRDCSSPSLS